MTAAPVPAEMNKQAMLRSLYRNPQYAICSLYCVLFFLLSACRPSATPTPFIAPRGPRPSPTSTQTQTPTSTPFPTVESTATPIPTESISPTPQESPTSGPTGTETETPVIISTAGAPETANLTASPTPRNCTDSLKYQADLTYPDDTIVKPGQALQKQWRILNDGTCDWDATYLLKLVEGYPALAAASPMALYPARAGTKFTLSVNFTAPSDTGTYKTVWQATNPQGVAFGEQIYMEIIVKP